jgi:hypothetical protein
MVIEILKHVPQAYTADDGQVIHDLIVPAFERGEAVTVSFSGVGAVPTSFVNAAFVELLERFDFAFIKKHLRIVESTRQINSLIKERFDFETGHRTHPTRAAE